MLEIDFGLQAETLGVGPQLAIGAVFLGDTDWFENLQITPGRRLRHDADLVDCGYEGRRAPIADRRFRTVYFDDDIVDPQTANGGEHMFGGANQWTGSVAQHGLEFGGGDGVYI